MATSTLEGYPQLLSLAVHEFRTPASVVGGYLRMLQRDNEEPLTPRQRKMVDEAEKSCARLVALIAEMNDISRLDAGLLTLARQPLDLFRVLDHVAEHVHEGRDRGVQLSVRGDEVAPIVGDDARLRSAFEAVFRAILREKAGPATVVVDRRREESDGRRSAIVVIADEASVQEAYKRQRGVFDDKRGGLGLAIPLARRVIEAHGGQLWSPQPAAGKLDDPLARGSAIVVLPTTE